MKFAKTLGPIKLGTTLGAVITWVHFFGAAALLLPGGTEGFDWTYEDADDYGGFVLYAHNCRAQMIVNGEVILEVEATRPIWGIDIAGKEKHYRPPIKVGLKMINPFFVPVDGGASGTIIGLSFK